MNSTELAHKMLQWEELIRKAQVLECEIAQAVLEIGKTQVVGCVRATYSKGRTSYDYETAGKTAPAEIIAQYTVPKTDWRKVCQEAGIEAPVAKQSPPSVRLKLQD